MAELARPFLPTRHFEQAKQFYLALGFELRLDGDVAIFGIGASSFILQRPYEDMPEAHYMMQLMVDDLDAWWTKLAALDLAKLGAPPAKPPAMQPWGLRVAFVTDPSGVLWHVAERRPGVAHDR